MPAPRPVILLDTSAYEKDVKNRWGDGRKDVFPAVYFA